MAIKFFAFFFPTIGTFGWFWSQWPTSLAVTSGCPTMRCGRLPSRSDVNIPNKSELLPLLHSDMKLIKIAGQSILKFHFVWMPALGMLLSHFLWPGPLKVPQNGTDICCLCSFAWQPQCQLKHQRKLPWALSFLFLRTEKTRWNLSWSCWWPCASSGPFTASHPSTWRMDEVLRPLKMSSGYSCPQSGPSSNPPNTESLRPFSCWIPLDSISPYFSGTADWRTAWTITLPFVQGQEQPEQQIVLTVERKEMEGNWRVEVPDLYHGQPMRAALPTCLLLSTRQDALESRTGAQHVQRSLSKLR